MKRRQINKYLMKNEDAGLTAYAMILLGMTVMLFLFGFTTMWDTYTNADESGAEISGGITDDEGETFTEESMPITDPTLNIGVRLLNLLANSIFATLLGGVGVAGVLVVLFLFRKNSAVWTFIIPIILLVVLNVFVFPISALEGDMSVYDAVFVATIGFGFTTFLVIFFNLFYLLSVLEFIRGSPT